MTETETIVMRGECEMVTHDPNTLSTPRLADNKLRRLLVTVARDGANKVPQPKHYLFRVPV
jgi:hypothetical protein